MSRRLKIRVIRLIRVRKNHKQLVFLNEHESSESNEFRLSSSKKLKLQSPEGSRFAFYSNYPCSSVISVCNILNHSPFRYSLVLVYMPVCAE